MTNKVASFLMSTVIFAGCGDGASVKTDAAIPPTIDAAVLATCPPPTVAAGADSCTISSDVTLATTLVLPAKTKLDCNGRHLRATSAGTQATVLAGTGFVPSAPEVAVVVEGDDVRVENCTIEGANVGIVVLAVNKTEIVNNTIRAGHFGVHLLGSDNTNVSLNTITYAMRGRGMGVWMHYDADNVKISKNVIAASGAAFEAGVQATFVPLLPGSNRFNNTRLDGIRYERWGVRDGVRFGLNLINMVLNGKLTQFATKDFDAVTFKPEQWGENLIIEENDVTPGPGSGTFAISVGGGQISPKLRNNTIHTGGLHFSGPSNETYVLPAGCSLDATRLCVTDEDCLIAGIDTATKGTCTTTTAVINQGVKNGEITNNVVTGPFAPPVQFFGSAISTFVNSENALIEGNIVTGTTAGIFLFGKAPLETATVKHNTVSVNGSALMLRDLSLTGTSTTNIFTATVTQNDFVGSTTQAVTLSGAYTIATDLKGNFWGRTCTAGGFIVGTDGPPTVSDTAPYGLPVATASPVPAVCP